MFNHAAAAAARIAAPLAHACLLGYPPPLQGKLHRTYSGCVGAVFGRKGFHISAWLQHVSLILYALAYTIVAAQSLQTVARSVCEAHNTSSCFDAFWQW